MQSDPRAWLVEHLRELRAQAGQPSLHDLKEHDPHLLVPQTVSNLLSGKFKRLPPWERIAAFVMACVRIGVAKKLVMPPEDVLLAQWRHRHALLAVALDQAPPGDRSAAAGATAEDAGAAPAVSGAARRRFGAVPPRAGAFQQRAVSGLLAETARGGGTTVLTGAETTSASVLTGLGGVGKTQLAADHAHTLWDCGQVDLLVWVSARNRNAITAAYAEVAIDLLGQAPTAPERAWQRLLEWLAETNVPWLVVLDDLQVPAAMSGLWPPHTSHGQVVATTRCRDAALHGHQRNIVDVDLFTAAEALRYLTEKLPDRARTSTADLVGLAEDLGYLPLALAQAAAYLTNKPLLTCADYRAKLANQFIRLRDVFPREGRLPDEHERTVAATWSLSIESADQLDPIGLARPVLDLASLLDPAGIPAAVFTTDATMNYLAGRLERDILAEDALGGLECLHSLSLLTLDADQPHRAVRVHALVQRAVREALSPDAVGDLAWAAADATLFAWPEIDSDQELTQALRSNSSTLQDAVDVHLWTDCGHPLLVRHVHSLGEAGLLDSAITAAKNLTRQATTYLGPDHHDTLAARGHLAHWRATAGELADATTETEQLLADLLRVLGPDHLGTLATRGNLARWRGQTGDPAGAATALEELFTDQSRVLGLNHPDTLRACWQRVQLPGWGPVRWVVDRGSACRRDVWAGSW